MITIAQTLELRSEGKLSENFLFIVLGDSIFLDF